jgi:hypothetical protein
MNYKEIYNKLMIKVKKEDRKKSSDVYYEAHHIKPKSFGGEGNCRNSSHPNIVLLTPKEHYIAHLLLVNIYPDSPAMYKALWNMCNVKKNVRHKPSAKTYCRIRTEYIKNTKGVNNHFFGKMHTDETKLKIGISSLGRKGNLGKKHTDSAKNKIRHAKLGKPISENTKQKIKISTTGGNHYNAKKIICLSTGKLFPSGRELSEYLNIPFSSIRRYLNSSSKPNWFKYERL